MTKVTILGEATPEQKELKPIELKFLIAEDGKLIELNHKPSEWKNIELICMNYNCCKLDLMFAYDNERQAGNLYLGRFNDGVV